jgi:hypothetical protein
MCRFINSILALTTVAGLGGAAVATRSSSIEGVWRAVEVRTTGPEGRTIGSLQPNLSIITAKHYSHIEIHSEGPRSPLTDAAKASAEELRQAGGPVAAEAGSYDVSREDFVTHPVVAKNPLSQGAFTAYGYRISGDTMWLTPQRNERGAVRNPPTIKFTRVE